MKLHKERAIVFFGCMLVVLSLFPMEEVKLDSSDSKEEFLNIQDFDFTAGRTTDETLYDVKKEKDEWVIVEKEPFPQLDLSLFDAEQQYQKNVLFSKGKLFEYTPVLIKLVFKKFANVKDHSLRGLYRYVPETIDTRAKPLAYFIIHGTSGRETEGYYSPNSLLFRNIVGYAAKKANKMRVPIDVYSYEWSGDNTDDARIYAGMLLGYMINCIKDWYQKHDIFAFSHGCNVGFVATNQLEFKVHEYIAVAPPILENGAWFYAPHNIIDLFSFLSRHDLVRWLGHKWAHSYDNSCAKYKGFCKKGLLTEKEKLFDEEGHIFIHPCDGSLMNIAYTEDNYAPGHTQTPEFLSNYLGIIMSTIRKEFTYKNIVRNISLNIVAQKRHNTPETFDVCNISLFPQNEEEEKLYSEKLPKKILDLSKKNEDDHFKLYGIKKNEESWWETYYGLFNKVFS